MVCMEKMEAAEKKSRLLIEKTEVAMTERRM
jgi:hypothetical protein